MALSDSTAARFERKALQAAQGAGTTVGDMGIISAILAVAYTIEAQNKPPGGGGGPGRPRPDGPYPMSPLPKLPPMTTATRPPPPPEPVYVDPGSAPRSTSQPRPPFGVGT